jgi:hypothetical protein
MRFISLIALVGCSGSWGDLQLEDGRPLGIGLTAKYQVYQTYCDPGPDADCGNLLTPSTFNVAVTSGPVKLGTVDRSAATVVLTGTGAGTAMLALTGNDNITTTVSIDVVPATTTLRVDRQVTDTIGLPDLTNNVHALTGSSLQIAQLSAGPEGAEVNGEAALAVDPKATHATLGDAGLVVTGDVAGAAVVSAAQPGAPTLDLDIVGVDAIATFAIRDVTLTDLQNAITLSLAQGNIELVLDPVDGAGDAIAGAGSEGPHLAITDGTIAGILAVDSPAARVLALHAVHTGSTMLDVTWGTVHKTIPVTVVN